MSAPADPPDPDAPDADPPGDGAPATPRPERRARGGGLAGSVLAGALLGLRDALEGKPKEDIVIQVDADGEPPDIDRTGLDDEFHPGGRLSGPPLDELKARAEATRTPAGAHTRRTPRRRPER